MRDRNTFKRVYLQYYPVLLVYGKTIVANEAMVEDAIQELFVSLWEKRVDFDAIQSLENYLLISLRNNLIRSQKKLRTVEITMDISEPQISDLTKLDREARLTKLIEQLPTRQREVIFLRYYKNKSYQEIAGMLDIQYQVARNFSYRAIQFLRKSMKKLSSMVVSLLW